MTGTAAACRWIASAICLGNAGRGLIRRYFREAVLPLDPALEAALLAEGPRPDFKACPVCGRAVAPDRRQNLLFGGLCKGGTTADSSGNICEKSGAECVDN